MHTSTLLAPMLTLLSLAVSTPATVCTGAVLRDPGFESGTTPPTSGGIAWTVIGFIGSSTYALTQPGSTLAGGKKYAFTAQLAPGPFTSGQSGETLTQTMHVCAGQNYSIQADYKFSATVDNNCSVKIAYPFKTGQGSVTTGSAISPAGVWYTTGSTFQAVTNRDEFDVVFACAGNAQNQISVDNVRIKPFAGNAF